MRDEIKQRKKIPETKHNKFIRSLKEVSKLFF